MTGCGILIASLHDRDKRYLDKKRLFDYSLQLLDAEYSFSSYFHWYQSIMYICWNVFSAGLDPARFAFTDAPPDARLDKSDARFVDVIHTDIGKWGLEQPVGHVDFYPNGGASQAGCEWGNDKLSAWSKSFSALV